jgi:hypothetical protein
MVVYECQGKKKVVDPTLQYYIILKKKAISYILNQSRNGSFELPCTIWKKTLIQ